MKMAAKLEKEFRTGYRDGESDWGMISRVIKRCFGGKASEERLIRQGMR